MVIGIYLVIIKVFIFDYFVAFCLVILNLYVIFTKQHYTLFEIKINTKKTKSFIYQTFCTNRTVLMHILEIYSVKIYGNNIKFLSFLPIIYIGHRQKCSYTTPYVYD